MRTRATSGRQSLIESTEHRVDQAWQLCTLRDGWLAHGLQTASSDRANAEDAVAELYRRIGQTPPAFLWADSPAAAHAIIDTESHRYSDSTADLVDEASGRIADLLRTSRNRLHHRSRRPHPTSFAQTWRHLQPPPEAAADGVELSELVWQTMWNSLRISLVDGVVAAIRAQLLPLPTVITWFGQQDAYRVGTDDAFIQLGLTRCGADDAALLDIRSRLVQSTGWWWAFDGFCVLAERPVELVTEAIPGGVHHERRLHHDHRPAIEFADGTSTFVLHGTVVPEWVIDDPTVARIDTERNVEIRRCAIERLGWDQYLDAAGLDPVDRADDPGNPGCVLELYSSPSQWRTSKRILLATNGSTERDGTRRRYAIGVPGFDSALEAAGWTYGLTGADYARLGRRT